MSEPEAAEAPAATSEAEERLPLRELDRALTPVRRAVQSGLLRGVRDPALFSALVGPHLARAAALRLPGVVTTELAALRELAGNPDGPGVLADLAARISRIDAFFGLPIPYTYRPVPKVRQADVAEAPPAGAPPAGAPPEAPIPSPGPGVAGPAAARVEPAGAGPSARADADEDDEDEGPVEFGGDLLQPLAEVAPADLAAALADFETVRDLLWVRPTGSELLAPIHGAGRELPGGRVAVGGRFGARFTVYAPGPDGLRRRSGALLVGAGPLRVTLAEGTPPTDGRKVVAVGDVLARVDGSVELAGAELAESDGAAVHLASWTLPGVADRAMRALFRSWAPGLAAARDPLPAEVVKRLGLASTAEALEGAILRGSEAGRRRFAFDEALLVQLAAPIVRSAREGGATSGADRGVAVSLLHSLVGRLGQLDDLVLDDQAQAIFEDLKRDLRRPVPSRRVLTGEVGGGKGRIALLAAALAVESKNQVLVVGADTADAEARARLAEPLYREAGYTVRVLASPPTAAQREALRRGEIHLAFAGPDVLDEPFGSSDGLGFRRLGLVIAFEREALGRAALAHARMPAPRPHLLVVTAVPAGARVLTTAYADCQVSVRRDPARRPAKIAICGAEERLQAYVRIRDVVDGGGQGVVVFPTVDGQDAFDIPDALRLVRALESDALKGVTVGLLHGAMPAAEWRRVVDDVLHRRIQVLVSTARVEDLPRIPGASLVVVEEADRMEQWRLHRVIGFFSRAERPATALLVVGDHAEPDSAARIDRVVSAPDGFALTEALVRLRGLEKLVAPGAAPAPAWRWVDPDRDLDLVLAAREEAHRLLRTDPGFRRSVHADLVTWLRRRWATLWPDAAAVGWACPLREEPSGEPKKKRRRRRRKR